MRIVRELTQLRLHPSTRAAQRRVLAEALWTWSDSVTLITPPQWAPLVTRPWDPLCGYGGSYVGHRSRGGLIQSFLRVRQLGMGLIAS